MPSESLRDRTAGAFGANAWLVEEMYEAYLADPTSVSESWREFFADYRSASRTAPGAAAASPSDEAPAAAVRPGAPGTWPAPAPAANGSLSPAGGSAGLAAPAASQAPAGEPAAAPEPEPTQLLRGAAGRLAENMR
ncbi:MAG TPA: hypothetical protein VKU92_04280, partial [Acidimicrobiales bacterium]|nr:hypothetical protein [Acidimicrobiales bacterium]